MKSIKTIPVKMNRILFLLLIAFSITTKMAKAGTTVPSSCSNQFASNIFEKVATGKNENVIFSPASIQTCLAMAFFGAEGKTAQEMRTGLSLGNGAREDIAKQFEQLMQSSFKTSNNDDDVQLRMANRIYVNENLRINPKFNELTTKAFQSQAEQVNFADSANAVKKINTFVEEQTQHKIKDLLQSGSTDQDTSVVLVNAIYFKGKWETPFSADSTHKAEFAIFGKEKIEVDTMFMEEWVQYGEFPDLDAKVVELRYKNSDLSMLFFLPNAADGLKDMEMKLACKDLNTIASQLQRYEVLITIPKFRIEYDLDLKAPLKELGLKTMFTDQADFSGLLENPVKQKVSDVKHKAFIDVNEAGSEAAAATFMKITLMSLNLDQKVFKADHPFAFAIRDPHTIYFSGHVTKF